MEKAIKGGNFDYRKAIEIEDRGFEKGGLKKVKTLSERQSDIREKLDKEYGTNLNKKEVNKMTKKQDVVTKVKEKKATNVTPVDLEKAEAQTKELLEELSGSFNGAEVEEVRTVAYHIKLKSKILVGVKCLVAGGKATYFLVVPESLKNFSATLRGSYARDNWLGEFPLDGSIKKYSPIIKSVEGKFLKAKPAPVKPVAKVAKVAKKNKKIKKTI